MLTFSLVVYSLIGLGVLIHAEDHGLPAIERFVGLFFWPIVLGYVIGGGCSPEGKHDAD